MHTLMALAMALSVGTTELPEPREPERAEASLKATVVERAPTPDVQPVLQPIEQREVREATAMHAQQPARGSFWWLVGAIVVAGVILAVLL